MVVFDLQCTAGHSFEGWFENLEDLEDQVSRGMVVCPVCGDDCVRRVPSSFGIAKSHKTDGFNQEEAARMLSQALKRHIKEDFEDVGSQFANEALKIHYGASESRNIRGVSTPAEEEMLRSEGVNFFKVAEAAPEPPLSPTTETDDFDDND
ncbi:DUF1178 family protein [Dethiosulfatarculus sandiegensis]|uniref:Uncharacterized protein n=1 Tax=Dethiosulfatarculus sandiegensis TaxID=1429043 RepID=A0A0D2J083_9BACT|nr:DUF1178 family protein [Dethiosulfatarculus sandiegensis]KIX11644.1 hypothetical protein X474_23205 [Dethiosulfatarculus sandiegensis]